MSNLAWGGYANGRIPASEMLTIPNFAPLGNQHASSALQSNKMRADAARQLSGLQQAFYKARKRVLSVSEAFRMYDTQGWYYNRYMNKLPGWTLAAFPGTSIHGWGLSADLNILGGNPSGEDLAWLRANAHKWGIVNDVSSEPWHWSYRPDLVTQTITVPKLITNPQSGETAGNSAAPEYEGDDGVDRIIRNKKTGSIDWINTATGFWWHCPNGDYVKAVEAFIGRKQETLEDNWWKFYKNICDSQRDRIASRAAELVWDKRLDANSAGYHLLQADKKGGTLSDAEQKDVVTAIIAALPKNAGGAGVVVDSTAIAKLVSEAVTKNVAKAVGDDLAARLKS